MARNSNAYASISYEYIFKRGRGKLLNLYFLGGLQKRLGSFASRPHMPEWGGSDLRSQKSTCHKFVLNSKNLIDGATYDKFNTKWKKNIFSNFLYGQIFNYFLWKAIDSMSFGTIQIGLMLKSTTKRVHMTMTYFCMANHGNNYKMIEHDIQMLILFLEWHQNNRTRSRRRDQWIIPSLMTSKTKARHARPALWNKDKMFTLISKKRKIMQTRQNIYQNNSKDLF